MPIRYQEIYLEPPAISSDRDNKPLASERLTLEFVRPNLARCRTRPLLSIIYSLICPKTYTV